MPDSPDSPLSPVSSTTSSLREDELESAISVTENTIEQKEDGSTSYATVDTSSNDLGSGKNAAKTSMDIFSSVVLESCLKKDFHLHNADNEKKHEPKSPVPPAIDTMPPKTPLFKEQLKYCMQIMKTLKRHRDSFPFNQPVDPIALQIPDYLDVIKQPMDFGTITNKLTAGSYSTLDEWTSDVGFVFSNCYTYNRPDNPVYSMGKNLEKSFDSMMKKMPTGAAGPGGPISDVTVNNPSSDSPSRRASITELPRRRSASTSNASPSSISGNDADDLRYALVVARDFWSKKISPVSWPFLQPVDPVALGIPDYLKIIKTPMDLGTVKRKLEAKSYLTASEFESDVRLVFSNCYLYNAPDSEVVKLCRAVEKVFNEKWANRPSLHASASAAAISSIDFDSGDDAELDEETASIISAKTAQIQQLQEEIKELMSHGKARSKRPHSNQSKRRATPAPAPSATSNSGFPAKKQKPTSTTSLKPLTFEEKRQLSLDINDLPPERLGKVLEIINESMPNLRNEAENGEIELDVDTLSLATLHALIRYVRQCKMAMKGSASQASPAHKSYGGRYSEDEDDDHGSDSD
ncbi:transcription initiation at TATA-containing promoter protein [Mitosporidium daphniae]|uniref:Bromodomain-containing protein n=1 Tax=Mitosporidium daphniae TaxID=1485682 RepID=A0A098VTE2_9MICR|nr:uncharacterized protein DI09_19p340 [Mitosporidium daphniae]KGG52252.1 hypothetical protein DI09_19p340 [Mitosporidium daphniae]|eukprot:XP_013238679.1 uncharacterized protein DI09_19p340 [Mitosporidium daphniae]